MGHTRDIPSTFSQPFSIKGAACVAIVGRITERFSTTALL
jgi:hypothetical protein